MKKGVLKKFTKFTGNHLCQGLFFNKVARLRSATLFKKETQAQVFSRGFCEISKNTYFTEHLWCLLLVYVIPKWFNITNKKVSVQFYLYWASTMHFVFGTMYFSGICWRVGLQKTAAITLTKVGLVLVKLSK